METPPPTDTKAEVQPKDFVTATLPINPESTELLFARQATINCGSGDQERGVTTGARSWGADLESGDRGVPPRPHFVCYEEMSERVRLGSSPRPSSVCSGERFNYDDNRAVRETSLHARLADQRDTTEDSWTLYYGRRQRHQMDLDKDVSVKFAERVPHSPTTTQLRHGDATTATVCCRRSSENRSPTPTETRGEPGVAMGLSDPCCSLARLALAVACSFAVPVPWSPWFGRGW